MPQRSGLFVSMIALVTDVNGDVVEAEVAVIADTDTSASAQFAACAP